MVNTLIEAIDNDSEDLLTKKVTLPEISRKKNP